MTDARRKQTKRDAAPLQGVTDVAPASLAEHTAPAERDRDDLAERQLLGAIAACPLSRVAVETILEPADLANPDHRAVYVALQECTGVATLEEVTEDLHARGRYNAIGAPRLQAILATEAPLGALATAQHLAELARRRRVVAEARAAELAAGRGDLARASAHVAEARAAVDATEPDDPHAAFTDVANAARFAAEHRGELRYCHELGWLRYVAGRWTRDDVYPIACAQRTARALAVEAARVASADRAPRLVAELLSSRAVHAMVALARARLAVRAADLDADPWLFNCANGTVDLRTATLRPHDPADLLTKIAPVPYDQRAACPTWEAFQARVLPDPDVRAFRQRHAGYALTGVVREHVLPIFYGRGANGKSTDLEALQYVMGDYARTIPSDVLLASQGDKHPTERAQLCGLRLAVANESDHGRALAEGTVKQLTGGDRISARFMRMDFFTFAPTHKLVVATNHRPRVTGTDEGIRRRVLLVPWTVTIPPAERDATLSDRLRAEAPGVLRWCVEGCIAWQREGLRPPAAVTDATAAYVREADVVGRFLDERCVRAPGASASGAELFQAFDAWRRENGERELSQTRFGTELTETHQIEKRKDGAGRMRYSGIGLRLAEGSTVPEGPEGSEGSSYQRATPARKSGEPNNPPDPPNPPSLREARPANDRAWSANLPTGNIPGATYPPAPWERARTDGGTR